MKKILLTMLVMFGIIHIMSAQFIPVKTANFFKDEFQYEDTPGDKVMKIWMDNFFIGENIPETELNDMAINHGFIKFHIREIKKLEMLNLEKLPDNTMVFIQFSGFGYNDDFEKMIPFISGKGSEHIGQIGFFSDGGDLYEYNDDYEAIKLKQDFLNKVNLTWGKVLHKIFPKAKLYIWEFDGV